ncbi:MAG: hypothetical protein U0353_26085 [Sandaracinus sp.]
MMRTRVRSGCALAIVLASGLLALPSGARAQERPHVRARYDGAAAPACLEPAALARLVAAQLGREAFVEPAEVVIRAEESSHDGQHEVRLTLSDLDGHALGVRALQIEGGDCRAIDAELALVVALLVDLPEDEVLLHMTPSRTEGAGIVHVDAAVSLAAVGTVDLLPGPALAARLGVELGLGAVILEAALLGSLPASADRDGGGAELVAWALRVGGCGVASLDVLRLGGCLALESGGLAVSGRGLDVNLATVRPWADLAIAARVGLRVGVFEVRLQPGIVIPFVRDALSFDEGSVRVPLFQAAPVAPALDLVLVLHFGS